MLGYIINKLKNYLKLVYGITMLKAMAGFMYGDSSVYGITKLLKHYLGVSEIQAYQMAIANSYLEEIIAQRIAELIIQFLDYHEENSNYWGE